MAIVKSLSRRNPHVDEVDLIASLVPPPQFQGAVFGNYVPDPRQLSQTIAARETKKFVSLDRHGSKVWKVIFRRDFAPTRRSGLYLDGGFGVGKTHLLAAAWHMAAGKKTFGTFVEYTNLAGALGFRCLAEALKQHAFVAIDEFELDDPGDTVLMSRLMRELSDSGVRLMATSNTLPEALGEDRFAAKDFKREIQALAERFIVLRIEGRDYRRRELEVPPPPAKCSDIDYIIVHNPNRNITVDDFGDLTGSLAAIHPSRYRKLVEGVDIVLWKNMETVRDQSMALRFVAVVDRLYDAAVALLGTGEEYARLFSSEMLEGGYKKKYYRALSRITALARKGQELLCVGGGR